MAGYEVIDGECVKSVDGCEQLNWFGCGVCNSQFVNANFVCVPRFCDIYNTNKPNQCQVCQPGFGLFQSRGQKLCRVNNCNVYENDNISCNYCYPRFYKRNQICVTLNCQTFNPDGTTCILCDTKYELQNGTCLLSNCLTPKQLICRQCVDGWNKDEAGLCSIQICLKIETVDNKNPRCVFCPPGRRLQSGRCIKDTCLLKYIDGICRQCPSQYRLTLNSYFCIPNKCSQYDQNTGECARCAPGFEMSNRSDSLFLCFHTKCLKYEIMAGLAEPQCTSCALGYSPFDTYCRPQFCLNYDV